MKVCSENGCVNRPLKVQEFFSVKLNYRNRSYGLFMVQLFENFVSTEFSKSTDFFSVVTDPYFTVPYFFIVQAPGVDLIVLFWHKFTDTFL